MSEPVVYVFKCEKCIGKFNFPCVVKVKSYGYVDKPLTCPWQKYGSFEEPDFKEVV